MKGGLSSDPQPMRVEEADDGLKSVLVDSVWDDMPAYATDAMARALEELTDGEQASDDVVAVEVRIGG